MAPVIEKGGLKILSMDSSVLKFRPFGLSPMVVQPLTLRMSDVFSAFAQSLATGILNHVGDVNLGTPIVRPF